MSLIVIGGSTLDVIFPGVDRLPAWPQHTEFTDQNLVQLKDPPIMTLGGNGANAAYAAARCGAKVTLRTAIGKDVHGDMVRMWLQDAGCQIEMQDDGNTPINVTAANRSQERATFFYAGSRIRLIPDQIPKNGHLLICGWPHPPLGETAEYLAQARARGVFTALDVGPVLKTPWSLASLRRILNGLDLFIANEHELKTLMREKDLDAALRRMRSFFSRHAVIKRGEAGALWLPEGNTVKEIIPAKRIGVVNTVGAGDSFNGGLMAALWGDLTFPEALRNACDVATEVVSSARGVLGVSPRDSYLRKLRGAGDSAPR